jgi:hypothetical protein
VIGQHRRSRISFYDLTFSVHLGNVLHLTVVQKNFRIILWQSIRIQGNSRHSVRPQNTIEIASRILTTRILEIVLHSSTGYGIGIGIGLSLTRALSRVINYFPGYSSDPFEEWDDLLKVDGEVYGSYADAFHACEREHTHPEDCYTDPQDLDDDSESEMDDDSEPQEEDEDTTAHPPADFNVFARQGLEGEVDDVDPLEGLGNRELDRGYDWGSHVGRYPNVHPDIWEQVKGENPTRQEVTDSDTSPDKLNAEQRKLYDLCVAQYTQELSHELFPEQPMPEQLLLNLDGVAGAGKTFALLKSSGRLQEIASLAEKLNPVFLLELLLSISSERPYIDFYGFQSNPRNRSCQLQHFSNCSQNSSVVGSSLSMKNR